MAILLRKCIHSHTGIPSFVKDFDLLFSYYAFFPLPLIQISLEEETKINTWCKKSNNSSNTVSWRWLLYDVFSPLSLSPSTKIHQLYSQLLKSCGFISLQQNAVWPKQTSSNLSFFPNSENLYTHNFKLRNSELFFWKFLIDEAHFRSYSQTGYEFIV
jgi:hypothetical protein